MTYKTGKEETLLNNGKTAKNQLDLQEAISFNM